MRVIGGHLRSRILVAPPGTGTRPTSDRLRETLFNVLRSRVQGARFADLYAGAGAVGIEALSRGAVSCLFVEHAPAALTAIRKNLATLQLADAAKVDGRPVVRALGDAARQRQTLDIVFLDPPYEAAHEYTDTLNLLANQNEALLASGALVVAEHARRAPLAERYGALARTRILEQGDAALSFYAVSPAVPPPPR